jgi:hypothetical protein
MSTLHQAIFRGQSIHFSGLQRPESHLVRRKVIEYSNAFDPALRILIRAPTEQARGYGSSKAKSARCLHRPPGPRDCYEILLVYRRSGWLVRGHQRWIALVVAKDDLTI